MNDAPVPALREPHVPGGADGRVGSDVIARDYDFPNHFIAPPHQNPPTLTIF